MTQFKLRWQQRWNNYQKALDQLNEVVGLAEQRSLNKWEGQGMIQMFEYTYELGWKVLADYLRWQGETELDDLLLPWQIDLSWYKRLDNPFLIKQID